MWGFREDCVVVGCLLVWLAATVRTTDSSSITWHEPPPSETVTDTTITSTTDANVTKGSFNEELSCNFSLTADMNILAVSFELGNVVVASYVNGQYPTVTDRFVSRFNATWVPSKLTLIVFNVTNDDKGEYRCRVQAFAGVLNTWLRIIKVDVLVQAQITNITGKTVTEGGNLTMKCLAEGNPTPTVTWRRLSDNSVVTMPLTNIRRQNASVGYRCIADNGVRTPAIGVAFIDVQYPVELIGNGENATVVEGGAKNFSCQVYGNPEPTIIWYKGIRRGGKIIYRGKEFEAREAGCYTCVAKNCLGTSVSITHCLKVNRSQELSTAIIITNPTSKPTPSLGSTNDASALSNSVFGQAFEQHPTELKLRSPFLYGDKDIPYVIVGDDIFPPKLWLMKPYPGKTSTSVKDDHMETRLKSHYVYQQRRH